MNERESYFLVINSIQSGGAEKQLLLSARTLAKAGASVWVFELRRRSATSRIDKYIEIAEAAGVQFNRSSTSSSAWKRVWLLGRTLRKVPHATIWSWGYRADGALLLTSKMHRRRWISSLRDANEERIRRARWFWRCVQHRIAMFVSNTWVNCEMLERYTPGVYARCRVLYNVLEVDSERAPLPVVCPKEVRVVMLGNIRVWKKGYDVAVAVAKRALENGLPVKIYVGGRRDELEWIKGIEEVEELAEVLRFDGEIEEPMEYLRKSHIFMMLSRCEGTPNALLEAMSLGMPCICTGIGDLPRLLTDGEQARLVPIGNPGAAYEALASMIADWNRTLAMGERGRTWCITEFSSSVFQLRLAALLSECERSNRSPSLRVLDKDLRCAE